MTHKPGLILLLLLALLLPASAFADLGLGSGFHVTTFSGDGEKGTQMYLPINGSVSFGDLYLKAQTAYVKTTYDPGPGGSESLSTLTDTKLNLSYGLLDKLPVDLLFGLDLNLPTGKTNLDAQELTLILDSDLVPVTSYGEGFNINPTISLLNPGDALSVTSQLQIKLKENWRLKHSLVNKKNSQ